jgi:hypothetical protein
MEQYNRWKVALVENASPSYFNPVVTSQERVPDDPRIPNECGYGTCIPITGPHRGDPGCPRFARVVQLCQSRRRHGVHGCGGRESQVLADMGGTSGEEKEGESGSTKSDRIWNPLFAVTWYWWLLIVCPSGKGGWICCTSGILRGAMTVLRLMLRMWRRSRHLSSRFSLVVVTHSHGNC